MYKVKGEAVEVALSPPTVSAGDVIQFVSEVAPGESSGPALAVLLSSSSGTYDVEVLGAEDCDYASTLPKDPWFLACAWPCLLPIYIKTFPWRWWSALRRSGVWKWRLIGDNLAGSLAIDETWLAKLLPS